MSYWYKEPLAHFFIIGMILFLSSSLFQKNKKEIFSSNEILIVQETQKRLIDQYKYSNNIKPTKEKIDELLYNYIEEEILYREALKIDLHKNDPTIRRTLIQKMRYFSDDKIDIDKATRSELHTFFLKHRENFMKPMQISFIHIFINPNIHKQNTSLVTDRLYMRVFKNLPEEINISSLGDTFKGGNHFEKKSPKDLTSYFDRSFIQRLFKIPVHKWSAPIMSGYGIHIVYILNRDISKYAEFNNVYDQVKHEWIIAETQKAYRQYMQWLRKQYTITIEKRNEGVSEIDMHPKQQ